MKNIILISSSEKKEVRLYEEETYNNEWWNGDPIDYEYLEWVDDNDSEWDGGYCQAVDNAIKMIAKNNWLKWTYTEYSYELSSKIEDYTF